MVGTQTLKFEESWFFLNKIGFRSVGFQTEWIYGEKSSGLGKAYRSRRQHNSSYAKIRIGEAFSDEYRPRYLGPNFRPLRDQRIPIDGPKACNRCKRRKALERDHIQALSQGGKDISENLQWLCEICHKLKTTEDLILYWIRKYDEDSWRFKMWSYRLEALKRMNPKRNREYVSYWDDPKTHYERWYQKAKKIKKISEPEKNQKLDLFIYSVS